MRLTQPLHPGMGANVLTLLEQMAPLPPFGFVAGQAVASALVDLYGAGGGVYNDVDVFVRTPFTSHRQDSLVLLPQRYAPEIAMRPAPSPDGGEAPEYSFMALQQTLVAAPTYSISGVRREELLNEVFYHTSSPMDAVASARCVLASFDINAVRVGVDLASGQLIWDVHFEQFCHTGELRLCALHTPYHSLLRLIRKAKELPEVSVNLEASAALVGLLSAPAVKETITRFNAATFWFGAKYLEQAKVLKGELAPYFSPKSEWRFFDAAKNKARRGYGDETAEAFELGTMLRRGEVPAELAAMGSDRLIDLLTMPGRVYRHFDATTRGQVSVPRTWMSKLLALPSIGAQAALVGPAYAAELPVAAAGRELAAFLTRHPVAAERMMGQQAHEQLATLRAVQNYLQGCSIPDADYVIERAASVSSAGTLPAMVSACGSVISEERDQVLGELSVPINFDESMWAQWPRAEVKVLQNRRAMLEWSARHELELPLYWGAGALYIGINLGRNPRDVSLVRFPIDEPSRLLDSGFRVTRRKRMPVAMQSCHRELCIVLYNYAGKQGWRKPR